MKKLLALLTLALGLSYGYQNSPVQLHNLGAAQAVIEAPGQGFGTVVFQITGTWSGTITFEGTVTGTWVAIPGTDLSATTSSTTTTANGMYAVACVGLNKVRARMSAYTSGTASVSGMAVDGIPSATLSSSGSGGAVTQSGIWNVRIQDSAGVAIGSTGKALDVNIKSGAGSGVSVTDSAAFTRNSSVFAPGGGFYQANPKTGPLASGRQGMWQMTRFGAMHVTLRDSAGDVLGNAANPVRFDPTGTTPQPVSQSGNFNVRNQDGSGNALASSTSAPAGTEQALITRNIPSGTQPISGSVGVSSVPADPFGANADAASATGSLSAKLRFIAATGIPITSSALPTGASTAAKQPALGTAGSASTDVLTVQGIASMTPFLTNPGTAALWGVGATGSAAPANAQLAGAVSSGNQVGIVQADNQAIINMSTATTTQIVALTSSQNIYVGAWNVVAAGTGTIKLVYGTGSNCGTGTTDLTPAYSLVAQAGLAQGTGLGVIYKVPASQALCVTTSAAVGMQGTVSYTKF